jgi:HSP20 family protein
MGSFTRRVYLSDHLDTGAIEAAYNNGVLAVRIPVVEQAKPRKIEIQRAANGSLHETGSTHAINS